ncbi:MAG: hypothetical protein SF172_04195 [Burkholderiales bacterium]|nr:hypothetical protein [Burkholderiales bacterium]
MAETFRFVATRKLKQVFLITNKHQYLVALANREKFRETVERPPPADLHPRAVAAMVGAARRQLADIESEIRAFEAANGERPV